VHAASDKLDIFFPTTDFKSKVNITFTAVDVLKMTRRGDFWSPEARRFWSVFWGGRRQTVAAGDQCPEGLEFRAVRMGAVAEEICKCEATCSRQVSCGIDMPGVW
jgi:hypothetical protein